LTQACIYLAPRCGPSMYSAIQAKTNVGFVASQSHNWSAAFGRLEPLGDDLGGRRQVTTPSADRCDYPFLDPPPVD